MTKRLVIGAAVAFVVISTSATSSTSLALAAFFKASFGPGVQRDHYLIPVIALAFAIYVAVMALVYPVFHLFFYERRGWSSLATGALLGLFCGFMWDALQGGIIEYATYHVSLAAAGLISRKQFPVVPPRVEYCLTAGGRALLG